SYCSDPATRETSPLSLHDALPILPIYAQNRVIESLKRRFDYIFETVNRYPGAPSVEIHEIEPYHDFTINNKTIKPLLVNHGSLPDRKSTRLNSSHVKISYAVFCLK